MVWERGNVYAPQCVIEFLEQQGGKNVNRYKGNDPEAVYFIGRTGEIEKTNNIDLIWIIKQTTSNEDNT